MLPVHAQLSRSISGLNAQSGAAEGWLVQSGDGRPLSGATVRVLELSRSVRSDDAGFFQLPDLRPGSYSISITADGRVPTRVTDLVVRPGQVVTLEPIRIARTVDLDEVQRLDQVDVSATELRLVTTELVALSVFDTLSDADRGYLSTWATSATRVRMPIKDITQVITVFNQEFLDDMAPLDLTDVLRYAPNADVDEGLGESFQIRGSRIGAPLTNGLRTPRKFPGDQVDVERVELLSGPASVLYGNVLSIGGVVNRVTKRPQFKPQGSLSLRYSDATNLIRGVFDATGPLGGNRRAAYRVLLAAEDGEFYKDFSYVRRFSIYPKFLFKFGQKSTLLVELDYTLHDSSTAQNLGRNYDYILYRTAGGDLVNAASTGGVKNTPVIVDVPDRANPEADFVRSRLDHRSVSVLFTSELDPYWSLRVAGIYSQNNPFWTEPMVSATLSPDLTIARGRMRERDRRLGNHFLQADAAGSYMLGWGKLDLVFGLEFGWDIPRNFFRQMAEGTSLEPFDFLNPDYSTPRPDFPVSSWDDTRTYQWAGFGVAQVEVLNDRLLLNAGVRVLDFRQTSRSSRSDEAVRLKGDTGVIPKWGALYRLTAGIGVYYGYGEAYVPSTFPQQDGSLLPPRNGRQHEAGVKLSLFGGRISATAAAFELEQVNIAETHPVTFERVPAGATEAKGIEVLGIFSPTDYWQIVAGYSTADKIRTQSLNQDIIGRPRPGVLEEKYSLWTRYRFVSPSLKGLAIGFGINYQGPKPIRFETAALPGIVLPGRTLYDALVTYEWGNRMKLQLNVTNITDELSYTSGTVTRFSVGEPRTISISATRTW